MTKTYEVIVIGSGFGGAITACRTAQKWPGKVAVIERGKRYPMGSFPRAPHDMARNFWNVPNENINRPKAIKRMEETHGMFDIRNYGKMDAVLAAGLGGGSLIYANVFLIPPDNIFEHFKDRWPKSAVKEKLLPYYQIAKGVLASRPIPDNHDPRRHVLRNQVFKDTAKKMGRNSFNVDLNVFFGNDFENPLEIGYQDVNRYGATQTSCIYCAECDIGCNTHSKNTLDLNYLFAAEHHHGVDILCEHLVDNIVPLDASGTEDPSADGTHGFRVMGSRLVQGQRGKFEYTANRVIVSAGSFGSTELLMRCRQVHKSLPRISDFLGKHFSGNGDFLLFTINGDPANPNYGPVITQATDCNLYDNFDKDRAFLVEDASYPAMLAWYVEGIKPGWLKLQSLWHMIKAGLKRFLAGDSTGEIGYAISAMLKGDLSFRTCVLLCMGMDNSNGVITLDKDGRADLHWPQEESMPLYDGIISVGKEFKRINNAKIFFPVPTWYWPMRKNVTVHSLGGCVLADDLSKGVTSADPKNFGEVFNYKNLHVADGSILPSALGANPTATISALSEMVAEAITGQKPDISLGVPEDAQFKPVKK